MSEVELPPLPEPHLLLRGDVSTAISCEEGKTLPLYTADQLRAYANLAVDAALEAAAREADERATDCEESHASDEDERWLIYAKHARRLSAAIRALKGQK